MGEEAIPIPIPCFDMRSKPQKSKPRMNWMKWVVIFLCWTGFALFFTTQSYIVQARYNGKVNWEGTLVDWLLGSYSWFILTPLVLQMSKLFPLQRGKLLRSVGVHSFAAPFFNIVNIVIFIVAKGAIFGPFPDTRSFFE